MSLTVLDDKEVKRILRAVKKANRKHRGAEPLLEFALMVKPKDARHNIKIITGTVPASFRYVPRAPTRSRKSG